MRPYIKAEMSFTICDDIKYIKNMIPDYIF